MQRVLLRQLPRIYAAYGQPLTIVSPEQQSGQYGDQDELTTTPGQSVTVTGYLYELDVSSQAKLTAQGEQPPRFLAYLPYRDEAGQVLPLNVGGWHLEAQGVSYYPDASAVDVAAQGVAWELSLKAPGER